jgi:hypothetical protein
VPTHETTGSNRRRRNALVGVAVLAPWLALGGYVAHAAETASATPVLVSVTQSGPGSPAASPATPPTTSAARTGHLADTPTISDGSGGSVQQTIGVSVLPGPLTVTPADESVTLAQVSVLGQRLPVYRGVLTPVTVVDARGSLVGWRATVSLQAVTGVGATQLAHASVCASAPTPTMVAGNPADVVGGTVRSCAGVGTPVSVFFAAPGGGGGTYSDTADLTLVLPNGALPAQVAAALAVSVG